MEEETLVDLVATTKLVMIVMAWYGYGWNANRSSGGSNSGNAITIRSTLRIRLHVLTKTYLYSS